MCANHCQRFPSLPITAQVIGSRVASVCDAHHCVCLHRRPSVSRAALTRVGGGVLARLCGCSGAWRWLPAMIAARLLTPHNGGRGHRSTESESRSQTLDRSLLTLPSITITALKSIFLKWINGNRFAKLWLHKYMSYPDRRRGKRSSKRMQVTSLTIWRRNKMCLSTPIKLWKKKCLFCGCGLYCTSS